MPKPKRDERLRFDSMPRHKPKSKLLRDRRDNKCRFQHRKSLPNTPPRSIAKRKIRPRGNLSRRSIYPSFRTKLFRRAKKSRVALRDPLRNQDGGVTPKLVSTQAERLDRRPRHNVSGRIQPQRLIQHRLQIRHFHQIAYLWRSAAEHGAQFIEQARFSPGIFAKQVPRP